MVTIELSDDLAATLRAAVGKMLSDEGEAVNRLRPGKRRNEHEKRELRLRAILKAVNHAIQEAKDVEALDADPMRELRRAALDHRGCP